MFRQRKTVIPMKVLGDTKGGDVMRVSCRKSIVAALLALTFLAAQAPASESLIFYRNPNGVLGDDSRANAKVMLEIAREQGHITVWVTLDFEFNFYMEHMTPNEIAEQNAAVADSFEEVLTPLVRRRQVWHPPSGPHIRGPGCTVRANERGLIALLRNERLIQIVAMEEVEN